MKKSLPAPDKPYDRSYFDRYYRDPTDRVSTRESLERKVRMAVMLTEFLIGRRIQSVLDIGCGEAQWFPVLRKLRRGIRYVGVDSSDYVIERFGKSRNVKRGTVGDLSSLRLPRRTDLIVCADVLQYVETPDVERGLRAITRLLGGMAYIETFTTEDAMEGDRLGWHERSAAEYRRMFRRAGLTHCGPYSFVHLDQLGELNAFEHL